MAADCDKCHNGDSSSGYHYRTYNNNPKNKIQAKVWLLNSFVGLFSYTVLLSAPLTLIPAPTGQYHTNSQLFSCMRMNWALHLRVIQAVTKKFTKKIQMMWVNSKHCIQLKPINRIKVFLAVQCSELTIKQDCY